MTPDVEMLQYLHYHPDSAKAEIKAGMSLEMSDATIKRVLSKAVKDGMVLVIGKGRATKYRLTPQAYVTMDLNLDTYFDKDVDEREVQEGFNFELINDILPKVELFAPEELNILNSAQEQFRQHLSEMNDTEYRKEMERLGIDLSWKSSQIEGIHTLYWRQRGFLEKKRQQAAKLRMRQLCC